MKIDRLGDSGSLGAKDFIKQIDLFDIQNIKNKVILLLNSEEVEFFGKKIITELEENGVDYVGPSSEILDIFLDKNKTKVFLSNLGFNVTAGFSYMFSANNIENIQSEIGTLLLKQSIDFPIVVKKINLSGGQGIHIIHDYSELSKFIINGEITLGEEYLIEEYIEGEEFSSNLFIHKKRENTDNSIVVFPVISKSETGYKEDKTPIHSLEKTRTSLINIIDDISIRNVALELGQIEGMLGFYEIELIKDKNGVFKIIEINPRSSGTTFLSFNSAGFYFADIYNYLSIDNLNTINLLPNQTVGEYSRVHNSSDFENTTIELSEGSVLLKRTCLKKHPPYIEKFLIQFDSIESCKNFSI